MTTNIVGRRKALFTNLCCVMTQWWHWPYFYHYYVIIMFMRCQVRILRIRRHDYRSNNEVLRHTGLLAASSIVCKRRLGLFGHVARLADRQIGSFGPVAKHKTVSGHVPTGGVPEADLLPPGLSRSAETWELRWPTPCGWQKTDRSGDRSQQWEATTERFVCRKDITWVMIFQPVTY